MGFENSIFYDCLSDIFFNDAYTHYEVFEHYRKLGHLKTAQQKREFISALYDSVGEYYRTNPSMVIIDNKYHELVRTGKFIGRFKIWLFYVTLFKNSDLKDCIEYVPLFQDSLEVMMLDCLIYNEMFYNWYKGENDGDI